jgi:secondary thiamine-phosphate synthase enzyme
VFQKNYADYLNHLLQFCALISAGDTVMGIIRDELRRQTDALPVIHFSRYNDGMKSLTQELTFNTEKERDFINITPQIANLVAKSGVQEGICLINAMHITASVFINDDESGLHRDFDEWLEKLAPHEPVSSYRHNHGEENADAHMKRQIMGREAVVAITNGKLHFGPWEQIFYGEFDGKRRKRVLVKIIGD